MCYFEGIGCRLGEEKRRSLREKDAVPAVSSHSVLKGIVEGENCFSRCEIQTVLQHLRVDMFHLQALEGSILLRSFFRYIDSGTRRLVLAKNLSRSGRREKAVGRTHFQSVDETVDVVLDDVG